MSVGRTFLRITLGAVMAGHGLQKLRGSFGGPGLEGTEQMMGAIGMYPAREQALACALSETVGGGLTAVGLLSPLGPAMVTGAMAVAIRKVHGPNGLWMANRGYEYNLLLIAGALALAGEGPGRASIDGVFGASRSGSRYALLALGLGLGGAAAALAIAEKMQPDASDAGSEDGESGASEDEAAASENA